MESKNNPYRPALPEKTDGRGSLPRSEASGRRAWIPLAVAALVAVSSATLVGLLFRDADLIVLLLLVAGVSFGVAASFCHGSGRQ